MDIRQETQMATKKKTAKKTPKKAPKAPVVKVSREEEYLLVLIAASERAITGQGSGVDEFFTQQANRLKRQLQDLRAKS